MAAQVALKATRAACRMHLGASCGRRHNLKESVLGFGSLSSESPAQGWEADPCQAQLWNDLLSGPPSEAYTSKRASARTATEVISSKVDLPSAVHSKYLSLCIDGEFKEAYNNPEAPALPADSSTAENPSDEYGPPCGFFVANAREWRSTLRRIARAGCLQLETLIQWTRD